MGRKSEKVDTQDMREYSACFVGYEKGGGIGGKDGPVPDVVHRSLM